MIHLLSAQADQRWFKIWFSQWEKYVSDDIKFYLFVGNDWDYVYNQGKKLKYPFEPSLENLPKENLEKIWYDSDLGSDFISQNPAHSFRYDIMFDEIVNDIDDDDTIIFCDGDAFPTSNLDNNFFEQNDFIMLNGSDIVNFFVTKVSKWKDVLSNELNWTANYGENPSDKFTKLGIFEDNNPTQENIFNYKWTKIKLTKKITEMGIPNSELYVNNYIGGIWEDKIFHHMGGYQNQVHNIKWFLNNL
tara:strand:+ start:1722 stop:2459 length:738 start_codon:yes stop_codon:yes gene_type:complete